MAHKASIDCVELALAYTLSSVLRVAFTLSAPEVDEQSTIVIPMKSRTSAVYCLTTAVQTPK